LAAVLINPGVALSTREVFAKFAIAQASTGNIADVPRSEDALIEFLAQNGNDLTQAAIACVPVIAEVLDALRAVPGVWLARMSGSGATCFALFKTAGEAAAAAWLIQAAHADWWVRPAAIG